MNLYFYYTFVVGMQWSCGEMGVQIIPDLFVSSVFLPYGMFL